MTQRRQSGSHVLKLHPSPRARRDDLRPTLPACRVRCLRVCGLRLLRGLEMPTSFAATRRNWGGRCRLSAADAGQCDPRRSVVGKDFRFAYVAQYSSRLLPWYYAFSAFWVGQAGSLLFWAWSVGILAMIYRFWPRRTPSPLREPAFAILMAYQCFLVAIMVFGADPMQPSLVDSARRRRAQPAAATSRDAAAPARGVPRLCRLHDSLCPGRRGAAERSSGRRLGPRRPPWAFFAWTVQGIGILVGAYWAYEELGWGGYWNWDPVENGSLIPWLTATAMIHAAMVYRQRGALKRTTIVLAVATFAACNFAAFLTRSGIFSSLHAFSQSPIGWMFLLLIAALVVAAAAPLVRRRVAMMPDSPISGLLAKEGVATASVFALILLAAAVFIGTVSLPVSQVFFPHKVLVGAGFYNGVLIPIGLAVAGGDGRRAAAALGCTAGSEASRRRSCLQRRAWRDGGRSGMASAACGTPWRWPSLAWRSWRRLPWPHRGCWMPAGIAATNLVARFPARRFATGGERTPATRCIWGWPAWPSAWLGLRWVRNSARQRSPRASPSSGLGGTSVSSASFNIVCRRNSSCRPSWK